MSILSNMFKRQYAVVLFVGLIGACTSLPRGNDQASMGTVSIKFDRTTKLCDIYVEYRGEHYKQILRDESEKSEDFSNLEARMFKGPIVNSIDYSFNTNSSKAALDQNPAKQSYIGFSLFGGCWQDISERYEIEIDQKIHEVYLEIWLPVKKLTHDGNTILTGPTPLQLLEKGFSVTIPVAKNVLPSTSFPDAVEPSHIRFSPSLLFTRGRVIANIKKRIGCTSSNIRILGGTLKIPPNAAVGQPRKVNSKPSLSDYDTTINQWEFNGTIAGFAC